MSEDHKTIHDKVVKFLDPKVWTHGDSLKNSIEAALEMTEIEFRALVLATLSDLVFYARRPF